MELYGQPMKLEFLRFLRSQQRFESPEALTAQIEQDVQQVRTLASEIADTDVAAGAPAGRSSKPAGQPKRGSAAT